MFETPIPFKCLESLTPECIFLGSLNPEFKYLKPLNHKFKFSV